MKNQRANDDEKPSSYLAKNQLVDERISQLFFSVPESFSRITKEFHNQPMTTTLLPFLSHSFV